MQRTVNLPWNMLENINRLFGCCKFLVLNFAFDGLADIYDQTRVKVSVE